MMCSPASIPFRGLLSRPFSVPIDAVNFNELDWSLHLDLTGHKTRHTNSVERSSVIRYEEKFVVRTVALLQFLKRIHSCADCGNNVDQLMGCPFAFLSKNGTHMDSLQKIRCSWLKMDVDTVSRSMKTAIFSPHLEGLYRPY